MQIARVIGDVVATRKEPALEGVALLVIQPLSADGRDSGRPLVALDSVGAGVGETVFFVRGKEASFPFYPKEVPADAGIVGIIDHWNADEKPPQPGSPARLPRVGPGAPTERAPGARQVRDARRAERQS
jgi:microcompartment protein CcmK/EutM